MSWRWLWKREATARCWPVLVSELFPASGAAQGAQGMQGVQAEAQAGLKGVLCPSWPVVKHEQWRYTQVKGLTPGVAARRPRTLAPPVEQMVVFVNGHGLWREALPEGVRIEAATPTQTANTDPFALANIAALQSGVQIHIRGVMEEPLRIEHLLGHDEAGVVNAVNFVRIVLEDHAQATVVLRTTDTAPGAVHGNTAVEVAVGHNAHLRVEQALLAQVPAFAVESWHITQKAHSTCALTFADMYGQLTRRTLSVALDESAECSVQGAMVCHGRRHVDMTHTVEHAAPHGVSRQNIRAVLLDQSTGVFQGQIHVHPVAQKTDGHQLSHALMLSEQATFNAKPCLEIYADDVKCSHGATTSALEEDHLFYLCSRGIPRPKAQELLAAGFVHEVLERLTDPWVRTPTLAAVEQILRR